MERSPIQDIFHTCCPLKFHARRAIFYMQVLVSLTALSYSGYLLFHPGKSDNEFTLGASILTGIVGYWLPSPTMPEKQRIQEMIREQAPAAILANAVNNDPEEGQEMDQVV